MSTYSFNDHALRRFCETLKDAADPNGIIAAGRGGIWPRYLRETRDDEAADRRLRCRSAPLREPQRRKTRVSSSAAASCTSTGARRATAPASATTARQHLPGTDALRVKYRGALPALLTERTDMALDLVKTYVRQGITVMPFFRKTEIDDDELDAIAAYLTRNNPRPGR